jgi:hypothetical protein
MLNPHLLTIEKDNTEIVLSMFNDNPSPLLLRLEIPNITDEEIKTLKENNECIVNSKKYILIPWI